MKFLLIPALLISISGFGQVSDFDSINFSKADSIAKSYFGHDLNNPEKFAEELTKDLSTDVEKFRTIFRWVSDNVSFDVDMFHKQFKKENQFKHNKKRLVKWQQRTARKAYNRVTSKKLALSSGYSMLLEIMSRAIQLPCITIEGYTKGDDGKKSSLVWNAVKFNDKWYLADVAQASGYVDSTITFFYHHFNSVYFLTDPLYFAASHYPINGAWSFVYENPPLKEFLEAPVRSEGFIRNKINRYFPLKGSVKTKVDSSIVFRFTSNAYYPPQKAYIKLEGSKFFTSFTHTLERNNVGELYFTQKFNRKGKYKMLVYLSQYLTFIYEISVN